MDSVRYRSPIDERIPRVLYHGSIHSKLAKHSCVALPLRHGARMVLDRRRFDEIACAGRKLTEVASIHEDTAMRAPVALTAPPGLSEWQRTWIACAAASGALAIGANALAVLHSAPVVRLRDAGWLPILRRLAERADVDLLAALPVAVSWHVSSPGARTHGEHRVCAIDCTKHIVDLDRFAAPRSSRLLWLRARFESDAGRAGARCHALCDGRVVVVVDTARARDALHRPSRGATRRDP